MNTDGNENIDDLNRLTEVSLEMPDELYEQAIAMAHEKGLSLDEWVARLLKDEFLRRPTPPIRGHP